MIQWLKDQFNRIPRTWQIIGSCVVAILILLLLWFYGMRAVNGVSNWWYSRGTEAAHQEIQKAMDEAAEAKGIAADALKALEQEKRVTAEEKARRQLAEALLADTTKTANEKLRIYEEAIHRSPTVTPIGSVDELCARARAAGIACE
jgi:hypothetical protein